MLEVWQLFWIWRVLVALGCEFVAINSLEDEALFDGRNSSGANRGKGQLPKSAIVRYKTGIS